MYDPEIDLAGSAARPTVDWRERWALRCRGLIAAACVLAVGSPALSADADACDTRHVVRAADDGEWPTAPDRGPGSVHVSRSSATPVLLVTSHDFAHGHDYVVVHRPPKLTARQRRLLRRAERHARKAARLREKSGADTAQYVQVARPAAYVIHSDDDCQRHERRAQPIVLAPHAVRVLPVRAGKVATRRD